MINEPELNSNGIESESGLTPIHSRIHCAATPDTHGLASELDDVAIENFLDTVAEVALAIARRKEIKEL